MLPRTRGVMRSNAQREEEGETDTETEEMQIKFGLSAAKPGRRKKRARHKSRGW